MAEFAGSRIAINRRTTHQKKGQHQKMLAYSHANQGSVACMLKPFFSWSYFSLTKW